MNKLFLIFILSSTLNATNLLQLKENYKRIFDSEQDVINALLSLREELLREHMHEAGAFELLEQIARDLHRLNQTENALTLLKNLLSQLRNSLRVMWFSDHERQVHLSCLNFWQTQNLPPEIQAEIRELVQNLDALQQAEEVLTIFEQRGDVAAFFQRYLDIWVSYDIVRDDLLALLFTFIQQRGFIQSDIAAEYLLRLADVLRQHHFHDQALRVIRTLERFLEIREQQRVQLREIAVFRELIRNFMLARRNLVAGSFLR